MRVGIVVPAYNSEAFLERTIHSILSQTYTDWQCVIVDDGSRDSTGALAVQMAKQDHRLSVHQQENSGVSAARNAGAAALINIDALLFLDADDMLLRNGLQLLVAALKSAPEASAAVGRLTVVDSDDNVIGSTAHNGSTVDLTSIAEKLPCPAPCGFLLRKPAFLHAGGFPLDYPYGEDWFLFTLVARDGPMTCVPSPVASYRRHNRSVTASDDYARTFAREIRRLRADVYKHSSNSNADRRALRTAWRRHNLRKARQHAKSQSWRRLLGHLGLVLYGRPLDLSRLRFASREKG